MAQRKSAPAGKSTPDKAVPARSGPAKAGAAKAGAAKAGAARAGAARAGTAKAGAARAGSTPRAASAARAGSKPAAKVSTAKPPGRPPVGPSRKPGKPGKPGKSIVNQKQRPWGLIAVTVAVVLFAAAIVIVVVATHKSSSSNADKNVTVSKGGQAVNANDPYRRAALPAAMAINGVTYRVQGNHTHVPGLVKYDESPPIGGDHSQFWANCTGVVYGTQLANENAVHMLEHGAVWITYNPKQITGAKLATLKKYVSGVDRMAMSPYAGLKTPISLQAWGYQLFLSNPSDPRIAQFIKTLRYNSKTTPENASCSDPYFKVSQSKPGHPFEG
jgi:hypothetical protein